VCLSVACVCMAKVDSFALVLQCDGGWSLYTLGAWSHYANSRCHTAPSVFAAGLCYSGMAKWSMPLLVTKTKSFMNTQ
jgi:hypothetical protein